MYSFVGIFLIHPFQAPKEYAFTPDNQLHTSGSQRLRARGYICHVSSLHEQHTTNSLRIPAIMRPYQWDGSTLPECWNFCYKL